MNFEFNFIKIGRLYHIAAIETIGKLVGKYYKTFPLNPEFKIYSNLIFKLNHSQKREVASWTDVIDKCGV